MFDWVFDLIRSLFWSIASALLGIMDACYSMIREVAGINFLQEQLVWDVWSGIVVLFGFIIIYRIAARLLKALLDEDELNKFDFGNLVVRTGIIMGIIAAFPLLVGAGNSVGKLFVDNVNMFVGVSDDTAPSTIILSNYVSSGTGANITYTLSDIKINQKEGELFNEYYKFFPELSDLMTICILGCSAAVLMIAIALGIAKRLFGLVMLVVLSPLPLSSFIFKDGDVSGIWFKQVMGIYTCNFVQILSLIFVMSMSASPTVREMNILIQLMLMMGGFLFALGSGEFLGRVLGIDSSAGDTLQQMSQISNIGRGLGSATAGVTAAGIAVGGKTVSGGGSALVYGVGRSLGGQSIKNLGGAGNIGAKQNLAKPGTLVSKFNTSAFQQSPLGQFTSAASKHLYAASANRYGNSSAFQMGSKAKEKMGNFKDTMSGLKGDVNGGAI